MRVINLDISAFRSYKNEIKIRMDKLGDRGIYLVTGDTGAGKSSIFDAISYALYGEASLGEKDRENIRCKEADIDVPTFVKLEFEYRNKKYYVERVFNYKKSKRSDEIKESKSFILILPDNIILDKEKDINEKIKEVLGLDKKQYSSIAMIAQGQFLKILYSDTATRQEIFREIFKTERYKVFAEKIKELNNIYQKKEENFRTYLSDKILELEIDDFNINESLNNIKLEELFIFDKEKFFDIVYKDISNVTKVILDLENKDKDLVDKISSNSIKIEAYNRYIDLKNTYISLKQDIDKSKKNLILLSEDKEKMKENINLIKEDEKLFSLLEKDIDKYEELEKDELSLKKLKNILFINEKNIQQINIKQDSLKSSILNNKEKLHKLKDLEKNIYDLDLELKNLELNKKNFDSLDNLSKDYTVALKKYFSNEELYEKERFIFTKEREEYNSLELLYFDNIAGVLASKLEKDKPCMVCGSLIHPSKAVLGKTNINENELKNFKDKLEKNRIKLESVANISAGLLATLKEKSVNIKNIKESNNTFFICKKIFTESKYLSEDFILDIKRNLEEISKKSLLSSEKLLDLKKDLILRAELDSNIQNDEKELEKVKVDIEKFLNEKIVLEKDIENLNIRYLDKKKSLIYENLSLVKEELERLDKKIKATYKKYEDISESYNKEKNSLAGLLGAIKEKEDTLNTYKDFDKYEFDSLRDEAVFLSEERKLNLKKKNIYETRNINNKRLITEIKEKSDILDDLSKDILSIKKLSDTANASLIGKPKLMFETYCQIRYFDRILNKANKRLISMTNGQYELIRKSFKEKQGNSKSGLDIEIIDKYNFTLRDVKTLSGGEAFKASLCLALAMADEISESVGGIKIDSIFIDEGFGTLDEKSLDSAISTLIKLSDEDKLIGIISHVAELKEKIEKQIIVKKDKINGSTVSIVSV